MLAEHLTQQHDRASRRLETIATHVEWIHQYVLGARPARVLDLGCGPGLYTSRLARLDHECLGIDFSPASIAYAVEYARQENLTCEYREEDILQADYGTGFGLAMLIFGELNAFRPSEAKAILRKAKRALNEGGTLLLEPHTFDAVRGSWAPSWSWYSSEHGLFSDMPHLCLQERSWDSATNTGTTHYFVVDAETGEVTVYAETLQAYSDDEYRSLLAECGFENVEFYASLTGTRDESQGDLFAVVARKQAASA
jgi:SAM-dependent methyltransferase